MIDVGRDDRDRLGIEADGGVRRARGGAQREAGARGDGDDVRAGRDARAGDRHADHEARGVGDGDRGAGVGGARARERDGGSRDKASRQGEAGDGRARVDAVGEEDLADGEADGAVDLDDRGADRRGAGDAGQRETVLHHPEDGGVLIGERERSGVADGERTAAAAGDFEHAALELDEAAEIVGLGARAQDERAVTGLGQALLAVDRGGDQEALGRVEGIEVAEDVRIPAQGVVRDDEFAGRRTERTALDDGDGAGGEGEARARGGGPAVDEEIVTVDDLGDARAGRDARAGDRHADEQAGRAGDADGRRTDRGHARGQRQGRGTGGGGLQDAAGDDLEDAAIRDGKQRGTGGVEADGDRRDDVEERSGVTGGVRDVLAVEHAGERVARSHRHGDDVRADARGEAGDARAVGDGRRSAQRAEEAGEEVVAGSGGDAVDRALRARREREADRTAQALGDRAKVEDEVTTAGGVKVDGGIATGITSGGLGHDQAGDILDDVQGRTTEQGDAAAAQLDDAQRVDTIRDRIIGRGRVV